MRKGLVIWLIVASVLAVSLMVWVAVIGTQLDEARVGQLDLEAALKAIEEEAETIRTQRDELQHQVEAHRTTIEQLKGELEQTRGQAQEPAPTATPP